MAEIQPPSLRLPPLRDLASLSPAILIKCIEYLGLLYTPEVRGSKIRRRSLPNALASQTLSPELRNRERIATLRSDEFERAYAFRWLTYVLNSADRLQGPTSHVDVIIDRAASLLANCGGAGSAGIISRILQFPFACGGAPIKITLRDIPLENGDIASVGAQTWGGACVLAEIIAAQPEEFGLVVEERPLRVLELGAGTGLVGLLMAKAAERLGIPTSIICTDFYPSVLQNLAANISTNFPEPERSISAHFLDWDSFSRADSAPPQPPFDAPFDMILGADVIYEPEHTAWIHACVSRLLARTKRSQFHLVIPLRPTHTYESSSVEALFHDARSPTDRDARATGAPNSSLAILSKETIVCGVEGGASDEVEYAYYRIGWGYYIT
ncbi:putative methyltransferase-domain-containing protein [Mycena galericulata]|nr:putative methyltransferase-domain-containing protein [Mycena galericulata]